MQPPFVIGHAGAAGEAPANTLAGLDACLAADAEAMEIDVRLSADGPPILMHDETLDRTTNLTGPVTEAHIKDLLTADAGDGQHVPTLLSVLEQAAGQLTVMCELKATPNDHILDLRLVEHVSVVIRHLGAEATTAIHSFSPDIVALARRIMPGVSAALIAPPARGEEAETLYSTAIGAGAAAVSVYHECIDAEWVRAARRRQLTTWAWTADDPADWDRLITAGVDGIITNTPSALRRHIQGNF